MSQVDIRSNDQSSTHNVASTNHCVGQMSVGQMVFDQETWKKNGMRTQFGEQVWIRISYFIHDLK